MLKLTATESPRRSLTWKWTGDGPVCPFGPPVGVQAISPEVVIVMPTGYWPASSVNVSGSPSESAAWTCSR